ncbi:sensor histidine kinase [Nocardiopsis sp. NPDC007018]|uniref:sensor histidine kinase n=1 Tax=Nocardiopsis sp. NPDC007018 TaxID=3155721 RepID=UPI0033EFEDAC
MWKVWGRPVRACGRLVAALGLGMAALVAMPLTAVVALALPLSGIGPFLMSRWVRSLTAWADWHRRGSARWLGIDVPDLPRPPDGRFRTLVRSPATWRVLAWLPLFSVVSVVLGCLAVIGPGMVVNAVSSLLWWTFPVDARPAQLGVTVDGWGVALVAAALQLAVGLAFLRWATVPLADVHARMCVRALAPSEQEILARRVDELQRTRAGVVDAHGAELRRIERDLHDGTQARLVAIAMQLGVAKEAASDPAVAALLERAHTGTEEAMTELRDVIRGIYPPILADRGLPGALTALAGRTTLPVRLDVTDPGALPVAVETAAYYAVTESVTNAVRHSGAETISVRLAREADLLWVEVSDDGHGGVDEAAGSGVQGLRRRASALDGHVTVRSPAGGPTTIRVELPCGS